MSAGHKKYNIMAIKKYVNLLFLLIFISCSNQSSDNSTSENKVIINIKDSVSDKITAKSIRYICLENSKESLFSEITKVKFKNDKIYILDKLGQKKVYCFDIDGKFINKYGRIGKGPGEYTRIDDFDVDDKGQVHIYSANAKKILVYGQKGEYVNELTQKFYADGFKIIENDRCFFVLENSEDGNHCMYKIQDKTGETESLEFTFAENDKSTYGASSVIQEIDENSFISYVPLRNYFFLFNTKGKVLLQYSFDFNGKEAPKNLLRDSEELFHERSVGNDNFFVLIDTPIGIKNHLYGFLLQDEYRWMFSYDKKTEKSTLNKIDPENYTHKELFPIHCKLNDSIIVSSLAFDLYNVMNDKDDVPTYVYDHLEKGGVVLLLKEL